MTARRPVRRCPPLNRRGGFTFTDLLVTLAALSVIGVLIVTPIVAAKRKARLAQCTANLQQVSQAILKFATENNQTLPDVSADQRGDLWWWYKEPVKAYAGLTGASSAADKVFACPDDRGYTDPKPFHANARFDFTSYVLNAVNLPGMPNIVGWRVPTVNQPQRTLLVMEWTAHAPLSWHKSRTGKRNLPFYCDAESVVGFVDGHVSFTKIYYDGFDAAFTRDPIAGYDYKYSGN